MGFEVVLEAGSSVSVHTRIKDMCKAARNRLGYTNQDICNRIEERFGIEDFSINTVNNFFSERSKATTMYTTGYICAVLGISLDAVFGIENEASTQEEAEFIRQMAELKVDLRLKEQEIEHLKASVKEKDERIAQAHEAIANYRAGAASSSRKIPLPLFTLTLLLFVGSLIFIVLFLARFDGGNSDYGLFKSSGEAVKTASFLFFRL